MSRLPNTRVQRTRSSASPPHSPLTRHPLGAQIGRTATASFGVFLLIALVAACTSRIQNATRDTVIGEYVFKENNIDSKHGPESLVLRPDGTYVQRYRPGGSRPELVNEGKWRLGHDSDGSFVELDGLRSWGLNDLPGHATQLGNQDFSANVSLGLDRDGSEVELVLNYDLGQRYSKRRIGGA